MATTSPTRHGEEESQWPEDDRQAAEEDWRRTLERLQEELVPATHVVAIDGSADSDRAFSWAARSLPQRDRLLLIYGTRRLPVPGLEVTLLDRKSIDEQRHKQRRRARALIKEYSQRCLDAGRVCAFQQVHYWSTGDLANQICHAAELNSARTVIAGSRGLGPMQRLVLGSVSTALLHQCQTTVVIARRPSPQTTPASKTIW